MTVIDLEALDRDEVRALLATRLGAQPDDELVESVVGLTRGNPFYAEELLRAYEDGGVLEIVKGRARLRQAGAVSLSSRSALLHRVFSLGRDVRAVVRALTAFQRLSLDRLGLVAELTELDVRDVEVAFDALVRARILDPLPQGGWEFGHPILRATIDEDLGPAERRRLHRAIADRLRTAGEQHPDDLLELATHVSQSVEFGDAAAAAVLANAGDLTVRTAPRSAADWYGRAVDAVHPNDPHRGAWLAKQARALFLAQRKGHAAEAARLALEVLPQGTERERAAVVLAGSLSALGRMAEALAVTDAERPAGELSSRLLAERAGLLVQVDRFEEAEATANEALARATDSGARTLAVSSLAQAAFAQGKVTTALAMLDMEVASIGEGFAPSMLGVRIARASYLAYSGHVHAALGALGEVETEAGLIGGTAFRTSIDPAAVWALGLAGRWDEALERAAAAAEEFERSGELFLLSLLRTMEANILCERGDIAGARRGARRSHRDPISPPSGSMGPVRARHRGGASRRRPGRLVASDR